ncbi:hypothetical protein OZN62_05265 [Aurantiacibacter sp. MUD11]|uniref:hypothetical protein n=1 Tax=Aurantiacibacter sp. MUD11 TaxID=3003265 RepID=UPI0022AB4A0F|nr:hypothetical protein [Aurantiacibacter sp. MUD11]WAT18979.1 hypothetical protein OZN62_05265 [Aurantiacibacter sp. MUD11]
MFDQRFFSSKLGHAALVSIAAMVAFTIFAGVLPAAEAQSMLIGSPMVELA